MTQAQAEAQVLTLAQLQALADEEAEIGLDLSVASVGGGNFQKHFPPGWTLAYYSGYIEKGSHRARNPKAGEKNDPKPQAQHTFHLIGPQYLNDDGTAYQMDTFDQNIGNNEKAGAFLMFKAMNYRGDKKRFPQLLGNLYLVEIVDYVSKTAAPGTPPKSIINLKSISPAIDRLSGQPYAPPLPWQDSWAKLFMWEKPHLAGWDALYIDGTNETTGKSKNWIQETIVGATNFAGSPLEILLRTSQRPVPAARVQTAVAPAVGVAAPGLLPPATPALAPAAAVAPPVQPVGIAPNVVAAQPVAPVAPVSQPAGAVAATTIAAPVAASPVSPVSPTLVAPAPAAVVAPANPVVAPAVVEPVLPVVPQ